MYAINFHRDKFNILYTHKKITNKSLIFEVQHIIGSGNYGIVNKIVNFITKKEFAMKKMEKYNYTNRNEVVVYDSFTKILNYHKYIPKIYYIINDDDYYYIIMEYFEYGSLNKFYKDDINPYNLLLIVKKLIEIIQFIHNQGLIINDLKLENIVLGKNFKIRIIDYGHVSAFNDRLQLTTGSPLYLAPEIFKRIISNEKKDIWALGISLYEFITLIHPLENIVIYDPESNTKNKKDIIFCHQKFLENFTNIKNNINFILDYKLSLHNLKILKLIINIILKCMQYNYKERTSVDNLINFLNEHTNQFQQSVNHH